MSERGPKSPTQIPEGADPKVDQAEDCLRETDKGKCTIDGAVTLDRETDKSNATLDDARNRANGMDDGTSSAGFDTQWLNEWWSRFWYNFSDPPPWETQTLGAFYAGQAEWPAFHFFVTIHGLLAIVAVLAVAHRYVGRRDGH